LLKSSEKQIYNFFQGLERVYDSYLTQYCIDISAKTISWCYKLTDINIKIYKRSGDPSLRSGFRTQ